VWLRPTLTRKAAAAMLRENGTNGGFVVRERTEGEGMVLSTLQPSPGTKGATMQIQHIPIDVCLAVMHPARG